MTTTNATRQTVRDLIPAIGVSVMVRFEELSIRCTVLDAKNSWGKVRLLVKPVAGTGEQWIELGRLQTEQPDYACAACAQDIEKDVVTDDEGRLALTGRTGNFHARCALCAAPATHEITRRAR